MNIFSHVGRAKYCKKDSCYPSLCTKREATSGKHFQETCSEEEGEARDPSPDLEARQDSVSIMGDYIYRNHVAPRTRLSVPKDDFPIPQNCIDIQRNKNTPLSEPWIGVTRFALLNQNPPE